MILSTPLVNHVPIITLTVLCVTLLYVTNVLKTDLQMIAYVMLDTPKSKELVLLVLTDVSLVT